jgi:hypothetical protein
MRGLSTARDGHRVDYRGTAASHCLLFRMNVLPASERERCRHWRREWRLIGGISEADTVRVPALA